MRRVLLIAVLPIVLLACQGAENPFLPSKSPSPVDGPVVRPGRRDPRTGKYIPPVCVADGSYEKALECFRRATVIRFRTSEGQGTMTREGPGRERMMLYLAKGNLRGTWLAGKQPTGVVWSFNGAPPPHVPAEIQRIFELVTTFPDPKKKEGSPRLVGRDDEAITWEFTDARNGDPYTVTIDAKTGHMIEVTVAGMTLRFG